MLCDFIATHREAILDRARARVVTRGAPPATEVELTHGLPAFLEQLLEALRRAEVHEVVNHEQIERSATQHGNALFVRGLTVAQVVHDYGDLCQAITGLIAENLAAVSADEFQTLNLCLDDAIAGAVTAYEGQRERAIAAADTERLGELAHEMRNVLGTAVLAFATIKRGIVATGGATAAMLDRSHMRLNVLIERSLANVRLEAGPQAAERIAARETADEVEVGASIVADAVPAPRSSCPTTTT
jgi:hypothetical protein